MQVNKCNSLVLLQRNTRLSGIRKAQCLFQLPLVRNGQLSAAFCTATGQYLSTIGSLHTLAKTVNGFTTTSVWLECTFHCNFFSALKNPARVSFKHNRSPYPLCRERSAKVMEKRNVSNSFFINLPKPFQASAAVLKPQAFQKTGSHGCQNLRENRW